jgi:hypothetical protein
VMAKLQSRASTPDPFARLPTDQNVGTTPN